METEETEEVISTFEPSIENNYVRADLIKRFLNFIIDIASFYVFIFFMAVIIALVVPSFINALSESESSYDITERISFIILYALYMGLMEALLNGKSLGKIITGTKAVNLDGSNINASTAFVRGFSRAVPFCAFSAFGTPPDPWQDRWTDTMVIDEKKSAVNYYSL